MANLTITKDLVTNTYSVTTSTANFSDADLALMTDFGEPEVEYGGAITDGSGLTLFTLDSNLQSVKNDQSVKIDFAKTSYNNLYLVYSAATTYAVGDRVKYKDGGTDKYYECNTISTGNLPTDTNYWDIISSDVDTFEETLATRFAIEIKTRIEAAMATLRALTDSFSSITETTL